MRVTIYELRAIIQRKLREDLFTRGMHTPPTSTGFDREQLRDLTRAENPDDEIVLQSHLANVDCECASEDGCDCDDLGPVPPGNPSVVDGTSIGQDPYVSDLSSVNSRNVSR